MNLTISNKLKFFLSLGQFIVRIGGVSFSSWILTPINIFKFVAKKSCKEKNETKNEKGYEADDDRHQTGRLKNGTSKESRHCPDGKAEEKKTRDGNESNVKSILNQWVPDEPIDNFDSHRTLWMLFVH